MSVGSPFVLAASGLAFEARLAQGAGVTACCGQGALLASRLREAISGRCRGVISYGIAGGLDPLLAPGTVVIASSVIAGQKIWEADAAWSARLMDRLEGAVRSSLLATDAPVADEAGKRDLFARSGAAAVDMESHIAATCAAEAGLPFVALRAIADPAQLSLPVSALSGVTPGGAMSVGAVLGALATRPGEVAALIRLAADASIAGRALRDAHHRLGPGFGLLDLG